jgi:hypothetical protein
VTPATLFLLVALVGLLFITSMFITHIKGRKHETGN